MLLIPRRLLLEQSTSHRHPQIIQNSNNYYSLCDECWETKKRSIPKKFNIPIIRCIVSSQKIQNAQYSVITTSHAILIDVASPLPPMAVHDDVVGMNLSNVTNSHLDIIFLIIIAWNFYRQCRCWSHEKISKPTWTSVNIASISRSHRIITIITHYVMNVEKTNFSKYCSISPKNHRNSNITQSLGVAMISSLNFFEHATFRWYATSHAVTSSTSHHRQLFMLMVSVAYRTSQYVWQSTCSWYTHSCREYYSTWTSVNITSTSRRVRIVTIITHYVLILKNKETSKGSSTHQNHPRTSPIIRCSNDFITEVRTKYSDDTTSHTVTSSTSHHHYHNGISRWCGKECEHINVTNYF